MVEEVPRESTVVVNTQKSEVVEKVEKRIKEEKKKSSKSKSNKKEKRNKSKKGEKGEKGDSFVEMAMKFDKDGDGRLSRDELAELAREMRKKTEE